MYSGIYVMVANLFQSQYRYHRHLDFNNSGAICLMILIDRAESQLNEKDLTSEKNVT